IFNTLCSCINSYADKNVQYVLKESITKLGIAPKFALIVVDWSRDTPMQNKVDFSALSLLLRPKDSKMGWNKGVIAIIFDELHDMIHVLQNELPVHLCHFNYRVVSYGNPRRNDKFKRGVVPLTTLYSH